MPKPLATRRHRPLSLAILRAWPDDAPSMVAEVLGRRHPLARAVEGQTVVVRQSLTLAPLAVAAAGVALVARDPRAEALAAAGLATLCALLAIAWRCRRRARRQAARLVLAGLETVPLLTIARERDRLLAPAARERLAARLERHGRPSARAVAGECLAARFARSSRPAARPVAPELLLRLAQLVRAPHQRAQGLAFAEALLSRGYLVRVDDDDAAVRAELRRAIALLSR